MTRNREYGVAFVLVSLLFLFWGIANNMNDTLLAAFKRIMSMSDLQTSLVQFAFYGAYFCFALPAAMFIKRHSFKSGILLGLSCYAAGCMLFYPAGLSGSYGFFLVAIYVMAAGCSVLETTANPYILCMGPSETATRRLNIAQTLNPLGAIVGILLSRMFILSELKDADASERSAMAPEALEAMQQQELGAISGTYMLIGAILLVLLVIIALKKMPRVQTPTESAAEGTMGATWRRLFANRRYRNGVIAQFFYVGAQTCVWSFTIRYVMAETACSEAQASDAFLASIIGFTLFRFIFTALMKKYSPAKLMKYAATMACLCTLIVIFAHGPMAIGALIAISACMSLMFPTIYGIALEGISPADTKLGASGLIMAILGGALLTPMQALLSDLTGSISLSFLVPLICFSIILLYSAYANKSK